MTPWLKRSPVLACDFAGGIPARGCYFGGGSSGGGSQPSGQTTTVQKSDPWAGQQPYLSDVFNQAQGLNQTFTPSYFPDSTVAPLDPLQQQAISAEAQRGADGSPVTTAAQNQVADTASGAYLDPNANPYFKSMSDNVLSQVVPGLESQFNQGNSLNNPGIARAVSQGATDSLGNLAGNIYETERGNQIKASALAPQTAGMDYQNIAAVSDAGSTQQAQTQAQLQDAISRFNFGQQVPYEKLAEYSNLVQGGYGGTSTLSQPYYQNTGANALGGALGGGVLGSLIGPSLGVGSSGGAAGGAGLGALLAFM